jgi:hypothetical protein
MSRKLNLAHIHKENGAIQPSDMSQLKGGDGCVCVINDIQGADMAAVHAMPDPDPCPCESIFYNIGIWW